MLAGPSTIPSQRDTALIGFSNDIRIFQQGNMIDGSVDGQLNPVNTGWDMFASIYTAESEPFNHPQVPTVDALVAYQEVLDRAGASHWRDPVDLRIIDQVRNQTGGIIDRPSEVGGYPEIENVAAPLDSDGDGMPDWWEELHGLDPNDPEDRNDTDINNDGYTNLEVYLNCLADPECILLSDTDGFSIY